MTFRSRPIMIIIFVLCFGIPIIGIADGKLLIRPHNVEAVVAKNITIECKTSEKYSVLWKHTPSGSHFSRDVYISRTIVIPYHERFSVVGDQSTGEYHLVVTSVQSEDSGRYECIDMAGHGEAHGAELIVLASPPECQSNINPGGLIGDNDCGIEPEDLEFSCYVKYSGNISPVLEWKTTEGDVIIPKSVNVKESANELSVKAIIRPNHEFDGHSITCKTTLSKVNWTSDTIKVFYVYNTSTSVKIKQPSNVTCLANSTQPCTYKWIHNIDNFEADEINGSEIFIDHPGKFFCEARCYIRGKLCNVQPKAVELVSRDSWTSETRKAAHIWLGVVFANMITILVIIVVAIICIRRRFKTHSSKFEYLLKTPVKDALIKGVAVLNGQVYVFRRGNSNVLVYRASDSYDFLREMKDTKVRDPRDAATCFVNKCLYVTDAATKTVWKMEENENITAWIKDIQKPYTISVSQKGRVLLPQQPNKIAIYASDASLMQDITLVDDIKDIQHAIELTNGRCLVSHGENNDKKHEVLMVDSDGKTIKQFGRERGWDHNQLYHPRHVTVGDGRVFVADKINNRIMILDEELKCLKEIRYPEIILNPTRLYYDKGNLMIGQYRALHIVIDVTSDGHSDRKRNTSTLLAAYFHKNDATVNGSSNDKAAVQCLLPGGVA